jgi:hypothetical protein
MTELWKVAKLRGEVERGIDSDEPLEGGLGLVVVDSEYQEATAAICKRATRGPESRLGVLILRMRQHSLEVELL